MIPSLAARRDALQGVLLRWRRPLLAGAAGLFCAGLAVSVLRLGLGPGDIALLPALGILLGLAPLMLCAAALALQISGRAVGRRLGFREALAWSAGAQIAELLPLPGGAMVRGTALMRAGASLGQSGWIVLVTAGLTLSLSLAAASLPLLLSGHGVGPWLLGLGLAGAAGASVAIGLRGGAGVALASLLVRLASLALGTLRLWLAFRTLGLDMPLLDAALFMAAATLGAATGIAPAGLGLSEAIGAAAAPLVAAAPSAAFLAIALNRLLGLLACGIVLALMGGAPRRGEGGKEEA